MLTGTPAGVGVGMDPRQFLERGDTVRIEITGLGAIEHTLDVRVRYGLAALFVGVVAVLIAVRDLGYLGGRTEGGPLTAQYADFRVTTDVDGGPVEIQYARPRFISPGTRYRAPRLSDGGRYQRTEKLLVGKGFEGGDTVFALEAEEPGFYYAVGFRLDYKRGLRRWRIDVDGTSCVVVGTKESCPEPVDPGDAPLAEIGGPSDYEAKDGGVDITLTNLTERGVEVSGLSGTRPDAFRLRSGAGRHVRVECGDEAIDSLRARVEGDEVDVPLTVPIERVDGSRQPYGAAAPAVAASPTYARFRRMPRTGTPDPRVATNYESRC